MHSKITSFYFSVLLMLVSVSSLKAAEAFLYEGQYISSGEKILFPEFNAYLVLQGDGNLIMFRGTPENREGKIWATSTVFESAKYHAIMQGDGNLVIYRGARHDAVKTAIYATQSVSGPGDYFFGIDDSGTLIIAEGTPEAINKVVWSNIKTDFKIGKLMQMGDVIQDSSKNAFMILQGDGNLVAFRGSGYDDPNRKSLWSTKTSTSEYNSFYLNFQTDGNLVLRSGTPLSPGTVLWASQTHTRLSFMGFDDDQLPAVYSGTRNAPEKLRWKAGENRLPTVAFINQSNVLYKVENIKSSNPTSEFVAVNVSNVSVDDKIIFFEGSDGSLYKEAPNGEIILISYNLYDGYQVSGNAVYFVHGNSEKLYYHDGESNSADSVLLGDAVVQEVDHSGNAYIFDYGNNSGYFFYDGNHLHALPTGMSGGGVVLNDGVITKAVNVGYTSTIYQWEAGQLIELFSIPERSIELAAKGRYVIGVSEGFQSFYDSLYFYDGTEKGNYFLSYPAGANPLGDLYLGSKSVGLWYYNDNLGEAMIDFFDYDSIEYEGSPNWRNGIYPDASIGNDGISEDIFVIQAPDFNSARDYVVDGFNAGELATYNNKVSGKFIVGLSRGVSNSWDGLELSIVKRNAVDKVVVLTDQVVKNFDISN